MFNSALQQSRVGANEHGVILLRLFFVFRSADYLRTDDTVPKNPNQGITILG